MFTSETSVEPTSNINSQANVVSHHRLAQIKNRSNKTSEIPDNHIPKAQWFSPSVTANENVKMPHNKESIVINQSGGLKDDIVSFPILFKDSSADCASAVVT